ncbi:hypothetical protein MIMGU_mgv11b020465mg [Erythranthe guttata]|uniref:Uncharacterized protein n=1 Tax=Erythranthe guttata TaxID=4155 RepID=A0A022QGB6_ERYGU|nr:hypothetical protein MIMGU_mgv11b020465mg [Erythranthe guttata]
METREVPSAHFLIKIESFSLFDKYKINKYETSEFVAGEYKCDYISVNLAMTDTSSLPTIWEVNVVFNILLFNQIFGHYLYSPGNMCDPSNRYLVNDTCVFGAEVFVIERQAAVECLSLDNVDTRYKQDLMISDFSKLEKTWNSAYFIAGGQKCHRSEMLLHIQQTVGDDLRPGTTFFTNPIYGDFDVLDVDQEN